MVRFMSIVLFCCMAAVLAVAQEQADAPFVTISGIVKDKDSKKALENVSISIVDSHIGTVSSADILTDYPGNALQWKSQSRTAWIFQQHIVIAGIDKEWKPADHNDVFLSQDAQGSNSQGRKT